MEYLTRRNRSAELQRQTDHWHEVHEDIRRVQKKSISINSPGDKDEVEADAVARKVVNGESAIIQGDGSQVNRSSTTLSEADNDFQSNLSSSGNGQVLNDSVRTEMESKMSSDFTAVKIHSDSASQELSNKIEAKAFTTGNDIFFNKGEYNPGTASGKTLLAHELTHVVQQRNGKQDSVIQRKPGNGKNVRDDLSAKPYRKALQNLDITFLTSHEVGQNMLYELGIADTVGPTNKMTILQAGALAFNYGMLKLRMEYMYGTGDYDTAQKSDDLVSGPGWKSSAELSLEKFNIEVDRIITIADADEKKTAISDLVQRVVENPDMYMQQERGVFTKTDAMNIIKTKLGGPGAEVLMDETYLAGLRDKIKVQAQLFFDEMLRQDWINTEGMEKDKVKMPDQFLMAVGDRTGSTGLAQSFPSLGVGYFMYDKDYHDETNEHNQTQYEDYAGYMRNVRGPALSSKNDVSISFEPGSAVQMRLSAYGFDTDGERNPRSLNRRPTTVNIYLDASSTPLIVLNFEKGKVIIPKTLPEGVTIGTNDEDGSVTLIFDQTNYGGKTFRVQTSVNKSWDDVNKENRDIDEIQVQLSTTGKISQKKIIKKHIYIIPQPKPQVEAKELFKSSAFVADISYVKNVDLKAQIIAFAGGISYSTIDGIVNGTILLDSIFDLTGGGVNPDTVVPHGTEDRDRNGTIDRFDLQDYSESELAKLYEADTGSGIADPKSHFDEMRSATGTSGIGGPAVSDYEFEYETNDELKKILQDFELTHGESIWSQSKVLIWEDGSEKGYQPEQVNAILGENITDFERKTTSASDPKFAITAYTSPLGMQEDNGLFETNLAAIPADSKTMKELSPYIEKDGKQFDRHNNDVLSALRAAEFLKFLLYQKAQQMDTEGYGNRKDWVQSLKSSLAERDSYITVKITGEHGTVTEPKLTKIYMEDLPEPKVDK